MIGDKVFNFFGLAKENQVWYNARAFVFGCTPTVWSRGVKVALGILIPSV